MNHRKSTRQAGFTLIEISIVLVIIGLLLGGVLKGQELIDSSRIKNGINDLNGVNAAFNGYVDRFRQLPGDDGPNVATLRARGGPWVNISVAGDRDGLIEITQAQVFTGGGEGAAAWQALKAAGFVVGDPAAAGVLALPRNAFNGLTGVGSGVTPAAGTAVFSVCLSQVPGKAARAIDTQLDDGISNRGAVLATLGGAGANTAPGVAVATYNEANTYTVCRAL